MHGTAAASSAASTTMLGESGDLRMGFYPEWLLFHNVWMLHTNNSATSDSSLKNSWAAYGPGNSNRLEIVVIHETNASKISSALKDSWLMK